MKSATIERGLGNVENESKLLDEGLKRFLSFFKLWLMLGQLEEQLDCLERAEAYDLGLKHCPNSILLWLSLANLEEKLNRVTSARSVLTLAKNKNPQIPQLWLAAIRAEMRHGNNKEADILMAMALDECPNSGILWVAYIESMAPLPRFQWKNKIMDALRKYDHYPHVSVDVAKLFWHHSEVVRARTWLNRVVTIALDIGDFWALYFKFELQHGTDENHKDVLRRCIAAQPKHGEKWQPISKALHNSHQPTEGILHQVVVELGKEESSQ
ncbi:PREDICTED: pre-mRNA-processing factor 6 [Prunus dulcis]|uniref:PREDICTED: pre-mRNA-processing factor 6 n=1 Tax=Prunus dulcis TaxID=3755 RepID=A0A5E4FZC8_PRUDU|nr:PREDICTED: pre-mRNA-processing factor 6 [Prunus dulcis]